MKAKLTINGKEVEFEISDGLALEITKEQLKKLVAQQPKKTGYERAEKDGSYYCIDNVGDVMSVNTDIDCELYRLHYENANYYSDDTVAENNARADKLLRQLRRFAVEHRENAIDWADRNSKKYYIIYNYDDDDLIVCGMCYCRGFAQIYFDSFENAKLAIKTFKKELIWYFTEYKDSL